MSDQHENDKLFTYCMYKLYDFLIHGNIKILSILNCTNNDYIASKFLNQNGIIG